MFSRRFRRVVFGRRLGSPLLKSARSVWPRFPENDLPMLWRKLQRAAVIVGALALIRLDEMHGVGGQQRAQ
jgi:hypothetical protein